MKKFVYLLFIIFLFICGYIIYDKFINVGIPKLTVEDEKINIDNIYIYGTHLNFSGNLVDEEKLDLVLYSGNFDAYDINIKEDIFNLSDKVNDGIYLEDIDVGFYYLFLRSNTKDKEGNDKYKYYTLNNTTEYKNMVYYTFSKTSNKIVIDSDNEYHTLTLNVSKNKDKNIYDIVVDPGHGGIDSGASKNGYNEADLTMKIALNLKKKLEHSGFSVKLTREEGQLSKNEKLNDYGIHGRAVISSEVKAKYVFSIHLNSNNSSYVHGIELYTADNINYDFIRDMAKNIHNMANVDYSTSKINKKFDGVYTRIFTNKDIENSKKDFSDRGLKPYDVTTKSNYYFMIRETGGIITGAYVDDRNEKIGENPYYKSNIGAEAYLLELGYLSNANETKNIVNNIDTYTDAIVKSCNSYLYNN